MSDTLKIAGHTVLAGGFFFVLQHFVNGADLQTAVMWAVCAAFAAGTLAFLQSRRGR